MPKTAAEAMESNETSTLPGTLSDVALWLLRSGWRYANRRLLFEEIARRLQEAGVPLWRMGAYIPTIDPEVFGDAFLWKRSEGRAQYLSASYGLLDDDDYQTSPLHEIARSGEPLRRRLEVPPEALDYSLLRELKQQGGTDYFGLPLPFSDDTPVQITFATDRAGGFSETDIRELSDLGLVLARVVEGFAVRMRVERLLNTYLGRDAGKRVLAGQILRGRGETIEAAILFADLRGFTALSERLDSDAVLRLLNAYFDLVGKAVQAEDGEILKFMGDGVMAVFPVAPDRPMTMAVNSALDAASQLCRSFADWNDERRGQGEETLGFGIALHAGQVIYGNVGASGRLDFTVIGPVVNAVSRLQTLCRELSQPVVMSQEIARHAASRCRSLGQHAMRGIAQKVEVFAPTETVRSSAEPGR